MIRVCLNCYANYTTDSVYQWDQNHELELTGLEIGGISAVHFCNKKSENAIVVTPNRVGDALIVPIPNILLEEEYNIIAYVHVKEGESAKTVEIINIPLIPRPKPDDYQFTENIEVMNFERLEKDIADFIATISADNEKFKTDFMAEYNRKVDSGYFASPNAVERLNRDLEQLQLNDTSFLLHFDGIDNEIVKIKNGIIGENLIPYPYYNKTHADNNITWTDNGDGTIGVSAGSATENCFFVFRHNNSDDPISLVLPKGTYTISGGTPRVILRAYKIENGVATTQLASDSGNGVTFTLTEDTRITVQLYIASGSSVPATTIKPMLEVGEIAHEYQPYVKSRQSIIDQIVVDNLLEYPYYDTSKTINDVVFTVNNDGTAVANGTATANTSFIFTHRIDDKVILPAGTYTVSGCPKGGNVNSYHIQIGKTVNNSFYLIGRDIGNGFTFTLTEDTDIYIAFYVSSGVTVSNLKIKPMLEEGPVAHSYRPYNLSRKGIVKQIIADNLLPYPYFENTKTYAGITYTVNADGSVSVKGKSTGSFYVYRSRNVADITPLILPKGTYVISGCPKGGNLNTYCLQISKNGDNGANTILTYDFGDGAVITLTEDTQIQIGIVVSANCPELSNLTFYAMVEKGTIAHTYSEYRKSHTKLREDLDSTIESVSKIEDDLIGIEHRVRGLFDEGSWVTITPAGTYEDNDYGSGATVKVLEDIKYNRRGYNIHIRGNITLVKIGSVSMFDTITLGEVEDKPSSDLSFLFAVSGVNGKTPIGFYIKVTTEGKVQLATSVLGDVSSTYGGRYAITTGAFEFIYRAC